MGEYYIYVHRDKDGKTFYVGKGKNDRAFGQDRSTKWFEKADGGYWVEVLANNLDEQTALFVEMCIIKALNPELSNTVEVKEILDRERYTQRDTLLQEKVNSNSEEIKKNKKKLKKLKTQLLKLKLTNEEKEFLNSNLGTMPAKSLTADVLSYRSKIALKIKKRNKLQDKISKC